MNNPYTKAEILSATIAIMAGVLGRKKDEINESDTIVDDLGADSLDFVEINANLEKQFSLMLPKKSALETANKLSGQTERFYSHKTGLTSEGLALLEQPRYAYRKLASGMSMYDVFNATTVQNVANMCFNLFNHLPIICPDCGNDTARVSAAGKALCSACSASLRPLRGDEAQATFIAEYLAQLARVEA